LFGSRSDRLPPCCRTVGSLPGNLQFYSDFSIAAKLMKMGVVVSETAARVKFSASKLLTQKQFWSELSRLAAGGAPHNFCG